MQKLEVKAVLFDFDGTLIDSMRVIHKVLNQTLEDYGLPKIKPNLLGEMAGQPLTTILKKAVKKRVNELTLEKVREKFYRRYLDISLKKCRPFPEVKDILEYLYLKNFRLAVVTSTPRKPVLRDLQRFNLKKYFDVIITREDVKNSKPSPEVIVKALKRLKMEGSEAVIVGDSPMDIKAGKAAGTKTVAVVTGLCGKRRLAKEKPDFILKNLSELRRILA
jgi:2-phosphoglycolate phosphatase